MIIDPGANASTRDQAKTLRKQAWKRPTKKADRIKLRSDRIKRLKEALGIGDTSDIQG